MKKERGHEEACEAFACEPGLRFSNVAAAVQRLHPLPPLRPRSAQLRNELEGGAVFELHDRRKRQLRRG